MSLDLTAGKTYILTTPAETWQLGFDFANALPRQWLLALHGDLGAGKTTFVKGLAAGYRCIDEASSPTFAIIQHYAGPSPIVHCDWYRLEREVELTALGWDELCDLEPMIVVEWVERFPERLPRHARHLHFNHDQERRVITLGAGW